MYHSSGVSRSVRWPRNLAESLTKGDRVIVFATPRQQNWETDEGEKRSRIELVIDEIGPTLRFATAAITRNDKSPRADDGPDSDEPF